jgi:HlyD family secretion protein
MYKIKAIWIRAAVTTATVILFTGCNRSDPGHVQGYIEGEFVYIASPFSGSLKSLSVQKGQEIKTGDALFSLDNTSEQSVRDEAARRLDQARASLEDARKAKRPTEIKSMESQLEEARAAFELAARDLDRQRKLFDSGASTASDLDHARMQREQDMNRVSALEADLKTASLGSRSDQIAALDEEVRARQAALAGAEWSLSQKSQSAPQTGLVFDTLYRAGEWVAAGHPVVVLLPPQNVKLRAFVTETKVGTIHQGDPVQVSVDGVGGSLTGKVSYISAQAEYTPPVIYSKENRAKLVFMIEAVFDALDAAKLHPGQPVDVRFGP